MNPNLVFWRYYAEKVVFVIINNEISNRKFGSLNIGVTHFKKVKEVGAHTVHKESPTVKYAISEIESHGTIVLAIDQAYMKGLMKESLIPQELLPENLINEMSEILVIAYTRGLKDAEHQE